MVKSKTQEFVTENSGVDSGKKPKAAYDYTTSERQSRFRENVRKNKGKRITVSLNAEQSGSLDALVKKGYSDTESNVVRKAIKEAWEKQSKNE